MKQKLLFLLGLAVLPWTTFAQTWVGGISDDWGTAGNWSPTNVPTTTGIVVINAVTGSNFNPKLYDNINVNQITFGAGSQLDVNGKSITVSNKLDISGNNTTAVTLNNSQSSSSDIDITVGGSTHPSYWSKLVANDKTNLTINGNRFFYEGYSFGCQYNGGLNIVSNSTGILYLAYQRASTINGALSVNSTSSGDVVLFNNDVSSITGNFSLSKLNSGNITLGNSVMTNIGGTVNINYDATGINAQVIVQKLKNNTGGGIININNAIGNVSLTSDSLIVNAFNFTNYRGSSSDFMINGCQINGNFVFSDVNTNTVSMYIINNTFLGNLTMNINGTGTLYEAYNYKNNITGNFELNINNTGQVYTSYHQASVVGGNYTVNRTVAGPTEIFRSAGSITGNFSSSNLYGGNTSIGNANANSTIGGKIDISYNGITPGSFSLRKITNSTTGGIVTIQNAANNSNIENDTLSVTSFSFLDYTGITSDFSMYNNQITGNCTFSDAAGNSRGIYIGNNTINGNFGIIKRGAGVLYEAYNYKNTISNNFSIDINSTATVYTSYHQRSIIGGNYIVNRTIAGPIELFRTAVDIGGNFSYINPAGGNTDIGNANSTSTILGKIDIDYNAVSAGNFVLSRIKNASAGGNVAIRNAAGNCNITNDTLILTNFNFENYAGVSSNFVMYNNHITGNCNYSDIAGNTQSSYIGNNTIVGNFGIDKNGSGILYEGYNYKNVTSGNFYLNINSDAAINTSYHQTSEVNGNYSVNRTAVGATNLFITAATIGGNFSYSNLIGGATNIGDNNLKTNIGGTVNINAINSQTSPYSFSLTNIKNSLPGGSVFVSKYGGNINIIKDTLQVNSLSVLSYIGLNNNCNFSQNSIDGNFSFSDSSINAQAIYLTGNLITGNTEITKNGIGAMYESYNYANNYLGNATFNNNNSGTFNVNYHTAALFHKGLTLNGSQAFNISTLKFVGNTNGIFTDNRATVADFTALTMEKAVGNSITLASPIFMNGNVTFVSGDIITSPNSQLTFRDNRTYTGASNNSKVIGPVTKIGNDQFTFPIGKTGKFIPLSISAPSIITDAFTAQVINGDASLNGYDTSLRAAGLAVINGAEYFDLTPSSGTSSSVFVTLGYNFNMGSVYDQSVLRVAHWNNGIWENLGNGAVDGNVLVGSVRTANLVSNFSPFAIASANIIEAPLPVQLLNFDAVLNKGKVNIKWKVAKEENLNRYAIERSADGSRFETLMEVNAQALASYQQIDEAPLKGKNYYRLRMIDNDGKSQLSKVALINNDADANLSLSPNPAIDKIQLHHADQYTTYTIFDMQGKKVMEDKLNNVKQIDISALSTGVYSIQLNGVDSNKKLKFVKQ